ncbi:MAG TPA: hypothetical protein VFN94_05475 [Nitrospiria bacterium]|nr:hypothetical protein [Nitrospiria bacterium]
MADEGKALFLKTAADMGKYYAFVGQALRALYDPASAAQLPADVLHGQIKQIHEALAPALDTNQVVKQNFEDIESKLEHLRLEAGGGDKQKAVEEARAWGAQIQERAKAVSDLVALFRRL